MVDVHKIRNNSIAYNTPGHGKQATPAVIHKATDLVHYVDAYLDHHMVSLEAAEAAILVGTAAGDAGVRAGVCSPVVVWGVQLGTPALAPAPPLCAGCTVVWHGAAVHVHMPLLHSTYSMHALVLAQLLSAAGCAASTCYFSASHCFRHLQLYTFSAVTVVPVNLR
jgi:hypothetical protein